MREYKSQTKVVFLSFLMSAFNFLELLILGRRYFVIESYSK
jgi:hypothetical protein